jgi:hypothetical protein
VAAQVADPQVTPVVVVPLVPPLVEALAGQSALKSFAPMMSVQLLPSKHVSWSALGLLLQI